MKNNIKIQIKETEFHHMKQIINLLNKSLSEYMPKDKLDNIWKIFSSQINHFSYVALNNEKIVGYGSILFEIKIRGGVVGHIEDIVVDSNFRKQGIGSSIIEKLINKAKSMNCYKLIIQCSKENQSFYSNFSFKQNHIIMQKFL